MSKFGSTQELYVRIGAHLDKLKKGAVLVEDFENFLVDSRELYERALVIRYKAFEKHASGDALDNEIDIESSNSVDNPIVEFAHHESKYNQENSEPKGIEELVISDDEPGFEFALFGETEEMPTIKSDAVNVEKVVSNSEPIIPEITAEPSTTKSDDLLPEIEPIVEVDIQPIPGQIDEVKQVVNEVVGPKQNTINTGGSLLDRFSSSSQSNRLADQLKSSRIESIPSSLTLNDRIRFAKNLFDGNSDTFNASIQLLDAQKSLNDAMELMRQYSERFNWNQDEKVTIDFYDLVERRYA